MSAAAVAIAAMAGAASAEVAATATADLNIRSGPGPQFEILGAIPANETTTVAGCAEGSKWCQISYNGMNGWSYGEYLRAEIGGSTVAVVGVQSEAVPVVTYDNTGTVAGMATGAIAGAIIGGPVGAAVGGIAGATAGSLASPPEQVKTYVIENRVDPVYLEGEVVVGARLPETVELREVPDYEYRYVYVNGLPVLVKPDNREIVYVYR